MTVLDRLEKCFFAPLEGYFGTKRDEVYLHVLAKEYPSISAVDLTRAALALMAEGPNGDFPNLVVCMEACKRHFRVAPSSREVTGEPENPKLYSKEIVEFSTIAPQFVAKDTDAEWAIWIAYFRWRGIKLQLDLMRDRPSFPVPCRTPEEFDPNYRLFLMRNSRDSGAPQRYAKAS